MPLDTAPPRDSRFGSPLTLSRVHWVRPQLVAEVKFLSWTEDNLLRQVVYEGLREDKPAMEVHRATPYPKPPEPRTPGVPFQAAPVRLKAAPPARRTFLTVPPIPHSGDPGAARPRSYLSARNNRLLAHQRCGPTSHAGNALLSLFLLI
jgi:hypothetical protein